MMRVNSNIFPKEGYFFVELDGTTIRASNWRGVAARVTVYRRRNKLAPGDPVNEVHAQACARNPSGCQDDTDQATKVALRVATLKGRVLAWCARLRARKAAQPLTFVPEMLMRARAQVCAGCPAHASIGGGCGACKKAIRAVRAELLPGKPLDPRLSGCSVLDEDVAISCWLDDQTVDNQELPGCCWRRRSPPGA